MKFKKISDTTIRCIISQQEMWEKGIEIDDFLDHRDKTEEFLRDIVEQARDELDMETIGHAFSVQLSVLRSGDISLLIVEDEEGKMQHRLEDFRERLLGFQKIMQEAQRMAEQAAEAGKNAELSEKSEPSGEAAEARDTDAEEPEEGLKTAQISGDTESSEGKSTVCEDTADRAEDEAPEAEKEQSEEREMPVWVVQNSMEEVLRLCRQLMGRRIYSSRLYKYQDQYYLRLEFAHRRKDITDAIMTLSEFCSFAFTEEQGGFAVEEHGQMLVGEDAVSKLGSL